MLLVASPASAGAEDEQIPIVHIVRASETLASIAQQYYGDAKRESVLVAENGLTSQGGAAIVVGLRLVIPTVSYYSVEEGDTWRTLAERFYGRASRVSALLRANKGHPGRNPDIGAQLLIPYPLRHMVAQGDTLRSVADLYYGNRNAARLVKGFNGRRSKRLGRGEIILIPLNDLLLSEDGLQRVVARTGAKRETGTARQVQWDIEAQLPLLREHIKHGRFEETVALGNWLLGHGQITGNQELTIQRELGTAYVALERTDLAVQAFARAISRQPDLELDSAKTSPRVMAAFQQARLSRK
jgi:LysM repeat protein